MLPISQAQSFGDIWLAGQGNTLAINQVIQIAANAVRTRPFKAESPYVGLRRFEAQYKQLFFGRDQLIGEILLLIAQRPLVLVAGASGSGKSSVVRAGVVPQLAERLPAGRFRALVMTPDQDPFFSLFGALREAGLPQRQLDALPQNAAEAKKNAAEAEKNAAEAKNKADESHATLLVALAQNVKEDPTAVATLLREPGHQDFTLWRQSAVDALQKRIAEVVLRGHAGSVNSVAFSPDGKKIVTGSGDRTARIWNADGTGTPLVLKGHAGSVNSVAFSPDGKKIVTGSNDRTARIWTIAHDQLAELLWNATSDCLSIRRRQDWLAESPAEAEQGYARCRQEVARRRGWGMP